MRHRERGTQSLPYECLFILETSTSTLHVTLQVRMRIDTHHVDLWDSLVGKEEMYARDGLHLSGKGAAVFAEGLSGAVASGLGKVRYLN